MKEVVFLRDERLAEKMIHADALGILHDQDRVVILASDVGDNNPNDILVTDWYPNRENVTHSVLVLSGENLSLMARAVMEAGRVEGYLDELARDGYYGRNDWTLEVVELTLGGIVTISKYEYCRPTLR